jgi:hypothetical protein
MDAIHVHSCTCGTGRTLDAIRADWLDEDVPKPPHIKKGRAHDKAHHRCGERAFHAIIRLNEVLQLIPWDEPCAMSPDGIWLEVVPSGDEFHPNTLETLWELLTRLPEAPLARVGQCGPLYSSKRKGGDRRWAELVARIKPYQYRSFPLSDHCHKELL